MNDFETIDDTEMDNVMGGLSLSLGSLSLSGSLSDGLAVSSDLGSLEVKSPFTIATNLVKETGQVISGLLTSAGGALTELGNLFDFS